MVDPILKRRAVARNLNIPFKGRRIGGLWAEASMGHPAGYKHRSLCNIPKSHLSSRIMQDQIDEICRRQIRHCPPGPRRDFLIKDYELWVANGRPIHSSMKGHDDKGRVVLDKAAEPVRTWQSGRPISTDFDDVLGRERAKRLAKLLGTDAPA